MEQTRREFLKVCAAAGAVGALAYLGVGCKKNGGDNPAVPTGQTYSMNLADYPALASNNSAVSVDGTPLGRPLIVSHITGDEYHALDSRCTHQSCTVPPSMNCPCHGSRYTLTGSVIQGPAPRALTSFAVSKEGDVLTIQF